MKRLYYKLQKLLRLDLNYFLAGGFWSIILLIVVTLSGIIISSLFSQFWSDDVYGRYSFLMTIIGFLGLVSLPGMSQAITQASSEGNESFFWKAYKIVFKYSLFGTGLLLIGSIYFYLRQNYVLSYSTFLCSLIFPFNSTGTLFISYLNGKKMFEKASFYSVIGQFTLVIVTASVLIFSGSLVLVAFLSLLSLAILNIFFTVKLVKKKSSTNSHSDLIKLGKHLSFSQLFTISSDYLDKLLVAFILGFSSSAVYAFALILPTQIHNVLKTFLTLGQPKITEINQNILNKTLIKKSLLLEFLIIITVIFYIVLSPLIFNILYPNYKNAVFVSQIFSLSLLYFPSNLLALNLVKLRKNKEIYFINIFYNFITIISLIILLPFLGILGAAISKIISRLAYSLAILYYFNKMRRNFNQSRKTSG